MDPIEVSVLTDRIKGTLEADPGLMDVWVTGEVSKCTEARSGHWYFTIKDDQAAVDCVMWKGVASGQSTLPELGGAFNFHGAVSIYTQSGRLQFYVDEVEPVGKGDLHAAFERLKAKLQSEGLFDADRKRPIPTYPQRIGVVTSLQAAALQDVLHVIERRWPSVEVLVAPTRVQGDDAPAEIRAALRSIVRASVDVVILTRGGGSIEDLWAFNDEQLARDVAACAVPCISGVGHEVDFTLVDFVSDVRAPTPSAAAEVATPDGRELRQAVDEAATRLARTLGRRLDVARRGRDDLVRRLHYASPQRELQRTRRAVTDHLERARRAMRGRIRESRAVVSGLTQGLDALDPHAVLQRGYAHVTRAVDGRTVRNTGDVGPAQGIRVRVSDGAFDAVTTGQGRLFDDDERAQEKGGGGR